MHKRHRQKLWRFLVWILSLVHRTERKFLGLIDEYRTERKPINAVGNIMKNSVYEELDVPTFTDRTRASLKFKKDAIISVHFVLFHGHVA